MPLTLDAAGLPADVRAQFPHLASYTALRLSPQARRLAPRLLTGELVVAAYDGSGALLQSTGVQIPGVLDDLYARARDAELGPVWDCARHGGSRPSLAVWAPTATNVDLLLDPVGARPSSASRCSAATTASGARPASESWRDAAYRYEVRVYVPALDQVVTNVVTDPYSLALTTNSARSVLVDLDDPALKPAGWDGLRKPRAARSPRTRRSTSCTSATSRSPTRRSPPRIAARISRSRTAAATACATCATSRARA